MVALTGAGPVDEIAEKGIDVAGPIILHVKVIGMFPYVQCQERLETIDYGRAGITRADDAQPALVRNQPDPTAAEQAQRGKRTTTITERR